MYRRCRQFILIRLYITGIIIQHENSLKQKTGRRNCLKTKLRIWAINFAFDAHFRGNEIRAKLEFHDAIDENRRNIKKNRYKLQFAIH